MSYPDVVIACIEHKVSLEVFRALRQLVKHDNNMKDYSRGWLITITANHSNPFSLWQSQHAVCHCQESGKTATQLLQCLVIKWIYNIVLFGGRTRDVHSSSLLIDVYALFLTLVSDGFNDPGWEIPDPFCSRAMLICSIIWLGKRMLRVVVLRVLFFVDMRLPPYSVSLICIVWSCFYVKLMQIN